jgi:hypothetical protein
MKTKVILILSLCLNLLAGAYWLKSRPAAVADSALAQQSSTAPTPLDRAPAETPPSTPTANTFDWRMVESDDYRQYIENLRAIGCPEETIRDIIIADVKKLFDARKKEMRAVSGAKFEFWKTSGMFGDMLDEDRLKQKQELAQERKDLLKALLGSEQEEKPDIAALVNPFEDMLDFIPEDKQAKIVDLMQTYQAKAVQSLKGGAPDAEDMKQIQNVQKEMETEMAKILTPEEMEDYQLRLSQTAMLMRMQLGPFEPNEQEFRDLFKVRKAFDDEHGIMGMGLMGDSSKMKAAQAELNEQIKQILSEDRYSDYERSQDFAFQSLAKVAERQGLPKESAVQVYDMKQLAEAEAQRLRADQTMSDEQRRAALQAIRAETENSITQVMGQAGFQAYQNQPGAHWIKNISPDPRAP